MADQEAADCRAQLRGQTRVLGALRETQLEQGAAIKQLTDRVGQICDRLDRLDSRVDQLSGAVIHIRDQHGARLDDIVGMLSHLIDRDRAA